MAISMLHNPGLRSRRSPSSRGSGLLTAGALAVVAYVALQVSSRVPQAFTGLPAQTGAPSLRLASKRPSNSVRFAEADVAEVKQATDAGEKFEFQAEVSKVMDIIINSLYSNKDVFLRELVSNGADACDKKRFLSLTEKDEPPEDMKLRISTDKKARTLIVEDNGIGMTKDELIGNLGNIARSGTAAFVKQLGSGDQDVSQIGQFGVGFYSAFLVAQKVEVFSRSFKPEGKGEAYRWVSEGSDFEVGKTDEELFGESSGTKLVLHLKEEAQEYLETGKLGELLKRYSEFITFPIELFNEKVQYEQVPDETATVKEGEPPKMRSVPKSVFEWETMNKMKPIWLRSPDVVNETEYAEFYKTTFKSFDEPLARTHFKVEGQIEFRALLFMPSTVPYELNRDMFADGGRAMRLYVKRVFINDKFEDLIPRWLLFMRGVVDSEDLPLNVGREILQKSRTLKIIRKRLVRKVLDTIEDLRVEEPEKFATFWKNYGKYIKVGLLEDLDYKDELSQLVRFFSSKSSENTTSLGEYVERMKEDQEGIYFASGEGRKAVERAPAMEKMNKLGYEVLYLVDPLDEMCATGVPEFNGIKLIDINKAGLNLGKTEEEKKDLETKQKDYEGLASFLKKTLGEKVQKVEISDRLVGSMATLVQGQWGMSPMMQKYMNAQATSSGQDSAFAVGASNQAILEINPDHPVIKDLKKLVDVAPEAKNTKDKAVMLYETAALIGGYAIEDTTAFATRVAELMEKQLEADVSKSGPAAPLEAEIVDSD